MDDVSFEAALDARVHDMLDACIRCGKCVEACPTKEPAGIAGADPVAVISGIVDIIRDGDGSDASRQWAASCVLSGECIKACDYGVNPRFLLAMARASVKRTRKELAMRRREGVQAFRDLGRDVAVLSQLQLDQATLERLGQGRAAATPSEELPDFVFYTGCNVLKTPHIALLALDIMDRLAISYRVLGGPSHCCGVQQLRAADLEMSGRMGASTIERLARSKTGNVLSWCPSCHVQFTETTLPTLQRQGRARPFELTPFISFLRERLADLASHLTRPVAMRLALHRHPGVAGVMEAAAELLCAVPGVELVTLDVPAAGLQSVSLSALPAYKRELQRAELEAAREAGVDALVAVYHSDHRELCAHERDWPFRIVNLLEVLGASMGLQQSDRYKELKLLQDADLIMAECLDLVAAHALDPVKAREVVVKAMLGDQPLPLQGRRQ
ncbi:MAG TPA: (Fe-S)-binding protein [Bradyrhizobium sp.]|nr:(Fe-S)-binding protein [Bradyrhizobium sp.]